VRAEATPLDKFTAHTKIRGMQDDLRRMMLILISERIGNSNAVIRQEFGKLRFQMIDDTAGGDLKEPDKSEPTRHAVLGAFRADC
jgi:hypothetical protein